MYLHTNHKLRLNDYNINKDTEKNRRSQIMCFYF